MFIPVANYRFDGPYETLEKVGERAGVFLIISNHINNYYLLDVDKAHNFQEDITKHKRRECWHKHKKGKMMYAFFFSEKNPNIDLNLIVTDVRNEYENIPCGIPNKIEQII
jgi:hypothetical protein